MEFQFMIQGFFQTVSSLQEMYGKYYLSRDIHDFFQLFPNYYISKTIIIGYPKFAIVIKLK